MLENKNSLLVHIDKLPSPNIDLKHYQELNTTYSLTKNNEPKIDIAVKDRNLLVDKFWYVACSNHKN